MKKINCTEMRKYLLTFICAITTTMLFAQLPETTTNTGLSLSVDACNRVTLTLSTETQEIGCLEAATIIFFIPVGATFCDDTTPLNGTAWNAILQTVNGGVYGSGGMDQYQAILFEGIPSQDITNTPAGGTVDLLTFSLSVPDCTDLPPVRYKLRNQDLAGADPTSADIEWAFASGGSDHAISVLSVNPTGGPDGVVGNCDESLADVRPGGSLMTIDNDPCALLNCPTTVVLGPTSCDNDADHTVSQTVTVTGPMGLGTMSISAATGLLNAAPITLTETPANSGTYVADIDIAASAACGNLTYSIDEITYTRPGCTNTVTAKATVGCAGCTDLTASAAIPDPYPFVTTSTADCGANAAEVEFTICNGSPTYDIMINGVTEAGVAANTATVVATNIADMATYTYMVTDGTCIRSGEVSLPAGCPVPVELSDFTATAQEAVIALDWKVASEINFNGYELERGLDGVNFEKLAWVQGSENSLEEKEYRYLDTNVKGGIVYYYRLKMIDLDGSYEYSPVRSAQIGGKAGDIAAFPNPTSTALSLTINVPNDDRVSIRFYDTTGKVAMERVQDINEGDNLLEYNVSNLPSGLYRIVVDGQQIRATQNVVIMD